MARDLTEGAGLADLPSGLFAANAAWQAGYCVARPYPNADHQGFAGLPEVGEDSL